MRLIDKQLGFHIVKGKENYSARKVVRHPKFKSFVFFTSITILMLVPNFLPNNCIDPFSYDSSTSNVPLKKNIDLEYNKNFAARFKSVESIVYYVKKHTKNKDNKKEELEILIKTIKQRFTHAYAVYGMQENWLAVLMGRYIWRDLSAKVIPDEILQNEVASCSQASIVLMDACRQLGIKTRKVNLSGHFAMEANVEGNWYFIDANLKPDFSTINGRKSLDEIIKKREQFALYANTILDSTDIESKFTNISYSAPNINPAPRAYLFQSVTRELSHWSWMISIFIAINLFGQFRKS